jgi:hypothetical protein
MTNGLPARTITVSTRSRSLLSRLKVRYPDTAQRPQYNTALALELIASTAELPARKHDLIVLLTEYRHALHSLATQATTTRQPDR